MHTLAVGNVVAPKKAQRFARKQINAASCALAEYFFGAHNKLARFFTDT